MEKAILKTLIYASIFDYPLKGYEVYKWLIGKETTLVKAEKALSILIKKKKIKEFKGFYFLSGTKIRGRSTHFLSGVEKNGVYKRIKKEKYAKLLLNKAVFFANLLKIIPWIKLAGISGGLALSDADKKDDIDLFLITSRNRIWISRFFSILILNFFGVRRKAGMKENSAKRKICLNTILDEDHLEQQFKNLYVAHEVLQMKMLWQRKGIYSKFLEDNEWTFKFLPNWTSRIKYLKPKVKKGYVFLDLLEGLAKAFQQRLMRKSEGLERIEDGALYFYPQDYREKILKIYQSKVKNLAPLDK